jgi:hypothetical protein
MLVRIASGLCALLLASSCATTGPIDVATEYAPGQEAQLAAYRTYVWAEQPPGTDPVLYPPGVEKNVKDSVDRILQGRGYQLVGAADSPDFVVGWHAAVDTKLEQSYVDNHYGYYWGPWGVGGAQPVVTEYEEGTLVLDIADAARGELVWRGTANARIETNVSDEEKRARIDTAATRILEGFPPKPQ